MTRLIAKPVLRDLPAGAATHSTGVRLVLQEGLGLATVIARRNSREALRQRIRAVMGVELPSGPRCAFKGDAGFVGTGPGTWLASMEGRANDLTLLEDAVGDFASLSDQSDAYGVLYLAGPQVREVLSKLVPVDVHPRAFDIGAVAATVTAHIGVTLWRLEDDADGSAAFGMSFPRSTSGSFWSALG